MLGNAENGFSFSAISARHQNPLQTVGAYLLTYLNHCHPVDDGGAM